jgi:hypothetical protein
MPDKQQFSDHSACEIFSSFSRPMAGGLDGELDGEMDA